MSNLNPAGATRRRERKLSDVVADRIKRHIMEHSLRPGERLPNEKALIELYNVSRGTVREALKSLEVQGVVKVRTGPGGGAAVTSVPAEKTLELLSNYFYSHDIDLENIYAVRKVIEPQLAEAVTGHLSPRDLQALERSIGLCSCEPIGPRVGSLQRIAELDFHDILAGACPNKLLGFYCRFITCLLKNLAVCKAIYFIPQRQMAERAQYFHTELVRAFRAEDAKRAGLLMFDHMAEAESIMMACQAVVEQRFLIKDEEEQEELPLAR